MKEGISRRSMLRGAATATAAATVATGAANTAVAQSGTDLSAWFENTTNYDGVVDKTGQSEVEITVGAEGNNGNFAFGPAAVRVDPGTKVVWTWNGKGGSHNVVDEDGSFGSEMVGEAGHTFEFTPEESGVFKYLCEPHAAMGMKGALVVGDAAVGGSESAESSHSSASSGFSFGPTELAIGGSILMGLVSPILFGAFLFNRDPDRPAYEQ